MSETITAVITLLASWIIFNYYHEYRNWKTSNEKNLGFTNFIKSQVVIFLAKTDEQNDDYDNNINELKLIEDKLYPYKNLLYEEIDYALKNLANYHFKAIEFQEFYIMITEMKRMQEAFTFTHEYVKFFDSYRKGLYSFKRFLDENIEKYSNASFNNFLKTTEPMTKIIVLWLIREFNYIISIPRKIGKHPKDNDNSSS